jgi:hypothetical protein
MNLGPDSSPSWTVSFAAAPTVEVRASVSLPAWRMISGVAGLVVGNRNRAALQNGSLFGGSSVPRTIAK